MAQLDTYRCDRCKKEMKELIGEKPIHISKTCRGDKDSEIDLCVDCDASFSYFMENVKQFDSLAETIATARETKAIAQ